MAGTVFKEFYMKKVVLFLALALLVAGGVFGQYNYADGKEYRYYPGGIDDGYRPLRMETNDNLSFGIISHGGTVDFVKGHYAGQPNIVRIESVVPSSNTVKGAKQWKVGDKTTIEGIMKDQRNVTAYSITTPNGYFVEFATYDSVNPDSTWGRQFGVILQGSEVWFYDYRRLLSSVSKDLLPSMIDDLLSSITEGLLSSIPKDLLSTISIDLLSGSVISIKSGAIAFDDEFAYASNLKGFMSLMAQGVDYDEIKSLVEKNKRAFAEAEPGSSPDFLLAKDNCKGDIYQHIIYNATQSGFFKGAVGGLAPPLMFPLDFVKVQKRFAAQANLAAAIGYLSGWYPEGGEEFHRQLTIDNYILFAGCDPNEIWKEVVSEMAETAITDTVNVVGEILVKKYALKLVLPLMIVSTAWDIGKGAWDEISPLREMGRRAIRYYSRGQAEFVLDPYTQRVVKYNGLATNVTIPDRIPDKINGINVEVIAADAFRDNKNIESITLGSNINMIEDKAFEGFTKLKTVTLRKPIKTIGASVFSGCGELTTVNLPSNVSVNNMTIEADAFKGTNLTFASKTAIRKTGYTGAGVGEGIFIVNNTGRTIAVIERSEGSSWPVVLVKSVKNGSGVAVDLATGKYDIRIRTRAGSLGGDIYEKKNVTVTAGATGTTITPGTMVTIGTTLTRITSFTTGYIGTTVIFNATDNDKLTTAECKAFIQARCSF
jgi:hypothetical protein